MPRQDAVYNTHTALVHHKCSSKRKSRKSAVDIKQFNLKKFKKNVYKQHINVHELGSKTYVVDELTFRPTLVMTCGDITVSQKGPPIIESKMSRF